MPPGWLDRLQRGGLLLTVFLYSAGYGAWGLALLLVASLLEIGINRRLPWAWSRLDPYLAAFLAAFLFSALLSPYRPVAFATIGLGALTIYLAFGSTAAVLRRDASFLRPVTVAWVAGALGAAVWGIALHRITGQPASTPALGQNALGTTLLIGTILALGLAFELRGTARILAAACAILLLAGDVLTYTRGAWLGVAVGGALVLGLSGVRKLVAGSAAAVLILLAGLALFGSERTALIERAASITDLSANQARVQIIRTSFLIFAAYPVAGTGFGTFSLVYPQFRVPDDPNALPMPSAHNIFMNMAAEGGIIGFAAFLAMLGAAIYGGWRWYRATPAQPDHAAAAFYLSAVIGAMIHQLFDGTLLSVHLGLGMWILLAVLAVGWTHRAGSTLA
jgi:O-antigen ligase